MASIHQWQEKVHALNHEKGFYDYEKSIAVVEALCLRAQTTLCAIEVTSAETDAITRVLADYKAAMRERKLLLVIGELCEAHEELRAGHLPEEFYRNGDNPKPEGYSIEMADAAIRLLDVMKSDNVELEPAMALKHAYNETRPYKHGKKF